MLQSELSISFRYLFTQILRCIIINIIYSE
jgi:hypothetical protein